MQPWTPATAAGKDKADEVSKKNAAAAATAAAKDNGGEAQSKHPCAAAHDANGGSAGGAQSNVINPSGPIEGHAANYGSNSGSNNNTNNGSTAATAAGAAAAHAETGGIDKRSNMMHMKRERRVAAVNKFREKRKERNFGKKVLVFLKAILFVLQFLQLANLFLVLLVEADEKWAIRFAGALPEQEETGRAAPAGARAVRAAAATAGGRGEITSRHTPSYT